MRRQYGQLPDVGDDAAGADGLTGNLDPSWCGGEPPWLSLFERWLDEAVAARIPEPNAMVLGTVDAEGNPSTRTVLCKGADSDGIVFFTGYESDKGRQLAANPVAAVTFPWIAMERQVHVRGAVAKVSDAESDAYWYARPRESRISAAASDQSRPIDSRDALESKAARLDAELGEDVRRPVNWGGYRIVPSVVEFWQGRANRLHNRVRLVRSGTAWEITRLQP